MLEPEPAADPAASDPEPEPEPEPAAMADPEPAAAEPEPVAIAEPEPMSDEPEPAADGSAFFLHAVTARERDRSIIAIRMGRMLPSKRCVTNWWRR